MVKGLFKRIFGDSNEREIARLQKIVEKINALEADFRALDSEALRAKTAAFRARLAQGETLDDLLPEAFAAVREASRRTIGLRHYDVQLIGGMILHQGKVAEMRTGEGKTLVATLPLYLNALAGQGTHLITPNDYLAKFGVQWMGPVYSALGMHVSIIQSAAADPDHASFMYDPEFTSGDDRYQYLRAIPRQTAYAADITYGTNNEFGFDYLRDNMVIDLSQCVQRELHYAIVDEVDSILIDEARTPLIISGPAEESSELYQQFAGVVQQLRGCPIKDNADAELADPNADYEVDIRSQVVILTEAGASKIERMMGISEEQNLYDEHHAHMVPYLDNALRAKEFYHLDKEYVIRDGEIIIVDQFTGRLMFGRRFSEGLHQAIEAKERVEVRRESLTYATITFQNFFRMYKKLAGMTGTAETEKEELHKIYDLDVMVLPTHVEYRSRFGTLTERQIEVAETKVAFAGVVEGYDSVKVVVYDGPDERYYRRLDMSDVIYQTESAKFHAVVEEIQAAYQSGRPVLVGTAAIETSERLGKLLKARKIPHNILNAKYHEKEGVIIAQAGRPGAVTIATNMAGRGVDILLGGNAEGLARDQLRKEEIDLAQIRALDWETALKMARRGEDPATQYAERWAAVLFDKVQQCEADRQAIYTQGGLHVIGTERHEARRIDNQLRGRAGRQGDPGSSRFYISLEDELMRRFGGERLQPWMERAGMDDMPLEFNVIGKLIASVQERVEGYNFDIRKHVLEYDNVVSKQREVVYAERRKILERDNLRADLMDLLASEITRVIAEHTQGFPEDWTLPIMIAELRKFVPMPREVSPATWEGHSQEQIIQQCVAWGEQGYQNLTRDLGEAVYRSLRQQDLTLDAMQNSHDPLLQKILVNVTARFGQAFVDEWRNQPLRRFPEDTEVTLTEIVTEAYRSYRERQIMLRPLDDAWVRHLTDLEVLREGINLRAIGQQNPLVAYQKEAFEAYQEMMDGVQDKIVRAIFSVPQSPAKPARRQPVLQMQRRNVRTMGGSGETAAPQPTRQVQVGARELGRNDPCHCGSGKKYKSCHLQQDRSNGIIRTITVSPTPANSRADQKRRK